MSPVEAAVKIADAVKLDPDLRRATAAMVQRAGARDIYEWCKDNEQMAVALAEQIGDIDGQVANMSYLLSQGDLS